MTSHLLDHLRLEERILDFGLGEGKLTWFEVELVIDEIREAARCFKKIFFCSTTIV
jgi:hypothetical protein